MFQNMVTPVNGGGSGLLNGDYKILGFLSSDSTSTTITVPSNTNFIIAYCVQLSNTINIDSSSQNLTVGILENIGDVATFSQVYYPSSYANNAQTATWTNATTITQTRTSNQGYIYYIFCQR